MGSQLKLTLKIMGCRHVVLPNFGFTCTLSIVLKVGASGEFMFF